MKKEVLVTIVGIIFFLLGFILMGTCPDLSMYTCTTVSSLGIGCFVFVHYMIEEKKLMKKNAVA